MKNEKTQLLWHIAYQPKLKNNNNNDQHQQPNYMEINNTKYKKKYKQHSRCHIIILYRYEILSEEKKVKEKKKKELKKLRWKIKFKGNLILLFITKPKVINKFKKNKGMRNKKIIKTIIYTKKKTKEKKK